jgi:hypothetical protein
MESLSRDSKKFHDVELHLHRHRNADPIAAMRRISNGLLGFRAKVSGKSHTDTTANSPASRWSAVTAVAIQSNALGGGALGIR